MDNPENKPNQEEFLINSIISDGKTIMMLRQAEVDSRENNNGGRLGKFAIKNLLLDKPNTIDYLKHQESIIGGEIFGPKATDELKRVFFFDGLKTSDVYDWFYYTERKNKKNIVRNTIHYEIKPGQSVLKMNSHDDQPNEIVKGDELENLAHATKAYVKIVGNKIYSSHLTNDSNNQAA